MDLEHYIQAIRKVVSAATGTPLSNVLIALDGRPEDKYPDEYATVTVIDIEPQGAPHFVQEIFPIDADEALVQRSIISANIDFFGTNASNNASLMVGCAWDKDVTPVMFAEEIGIRIVHQPENATALVNSSYEPRYTVLVEFYAEIHHTKRVETIESVGYSVADEDGNELTIGEAQ